LGLRKLNGTEIKAFFDLPIRHFMGKRVVVVLFAIIPVLVMFLFPIQARNDVTGAFIDDVGEGDLVGVKVGDWVKYRFSITGPAFSGDWEESIDCIRIEVQNVSGTLVTVRESTHYKKGDETINTRNADLRTHSIGPYSYIIATNHSKGDRILIEGYEFEDVFHKFFINGTVTKEYLGASREAYYSIASFTMPFFWDHINGTQEYYWDRETGFLLEHRYEAVFVGYENTTFSRWLMEIADTNLWETKIIPQPQSVWRQLGLFAFTGAVAGTVTVITFIKRRPKTNKNFSEV